jgi:hypothetical protein
MIDVIQTATNGLAALLANEQSKTLLSDLFVGKLAKALAKEIAANPPAPPRKTLSVKQLAELTETAGVRKYSAFTIRAACRNGRIKAEPQHNGQWLIPADVAQAVLERGLA